MTCIDWHEATNWELRKRRTYGRLPQLGDRAGVRAIRLYSGRHPEGQSAHPAHRRRRQEL